MNNEPVLVQLSDPTIKDLEKCFYDASMNDMKYIGVLIEVQPEEHNIECIIIENKNFDSKFAYYKTAYNEDLTHKTSKCVSICGFAAGNSFADIEELLIK